MNGSEKLVWQSVKDTCTEEFQLGPYYGTGFRQDANKFMMTLARYKFASKMIRKGSVLELGCGEGIGALSFIQNKNISKFCGVDFDSEAIKWAQKIENDKLQFIEDDFIDKVYGAFDAVISLDVIEHLSLQNEDAYMETICKNLTGRGCVIIGTPNVLMLPYQSEASRLGHINMYDQSRLIELLEKYFHNVFVFSMNDEIVHTGFWPMACYIMTLCTGKKLH